MASSIPPTVAVVGGGVAGLAAAWELSGSAVDGPGGPGGPPHVVVLEAQERLGGKLRAQEVGGRPVDVGADGFLGRRPEAITLCRELGLADALVPVGTHGASVWARGRLRPLPDGLVLGVPTRVRPLVRSGVLGPAGVARASMDHVVPRPDARGPLGDRAIGPLVARKLGRRVVDVLVDPLVGGIHAGATADMSAAAVFPLLLAAAQRSGSFMRSLHRAAEEAAAETTAAGGGPEDAAAGGGPEPPFWSLRDGVASLTDRLAVELRRRQVDLRTGAAVRRLRRGGYGEPAWTLETTTGPVEADGIVLTLPAPQAARLLDAHQEEATQLLRSFDHSSVTVVTLSLAPGTLPGSLYGTGLLVPRVARSPLGRALGPSPRDRGRTRWRRPRTEDRSFMVTAVTYLSRKWPHLSGSGDDLLRASLGRWGDDRASQLDDDAVVERVLRELAVVLGLDLEPRASLVTRWPDAFPQYRVHHPLRVAAVEAALRRLPAVAVAGATYHGVGIPACIGNGRDAARTVLAGLSELPARSLH